MKDITISHADYLHKRITSWQLKNKTSNTNGMNRTLSGILQIIPFRGVSNLGQVRPGQGRPSQSSNVRYSSGSKDRSRAEGSGAARSSSQLQLSLMQPSLAREASQSSGGRQRTLGRTARGSGTVLPRGLLVGKSSTQRDSWPTQKACKTPGDTEEVRGQREREMDHQSQRDRQFTGQKIHRQAGDQVDRANAPHLSGCPLRGRERRKSLDQRGKRQTAQITSLLDG